MCSGNRETHLTEPESSGTPPGMGGKTIIVGACGADRSIAYPNIQEHRDGDFKERIPPIVGSNSEFRFEKVVWA